MGTNRVNTTVVKRCGRSVKNVKSPTSQIVLDVKSGSIVNQILLCIMENDHGENSKLNLSREENETNSQIGLKGVRAQSLSQIEAEGELRMFVKKKIIETWEKLIYWQSVYLEEARKGGGTMGHKVGSLRDQQERLKELFEKL